MLEDKKQQLVEIAQKANRDGLCKHKSGNFSIKDEGSNYILIRPSEIDREKMTYDDSCIY